MVNFKGLFQSLYRAFERKQHPALAEEVSQKANRSSVKFYETEQNKMVQWLSKQPPLIVDAAARSLNWDYSEDVIVWLLNQPTTDAATAVYLFLLAEPSWYTPMKRKDGTIEIMDFDSEVVKAFTANWPKNFYTRGKVGFNPRAEFDHILEELKEAETEFRSSGMIPWEPLIGIEGPFKGPKSRDIFGCFKKDKNEQIRVIALFEDLGISFKDYGLPKEVVQNWRVANGFGEKK